MILPGINQLATKNLKADAIDSEMIKKAKISMLEDLQKRYSKQYAQQQKLLCLASALDSRFKQLAWLSDADHDRIFTIVEEEVLTIAMQGNSLTPLGSVVVKVKQEPEDDISQQTQPSFPNLPSLSPLHSWPSRPNLPSMPSSPHLNVDDFFDEVILVKEEKGHITQNQKVNFEII